MDFHKNNLRKSHQRKVLT